MKFSFKKKIKEIELQKNIHEIQLKEKICEMQLQEKRIQENIIQCKTNHQQDIANKIVEVKKQEIEAQERQNQGYKERKAKHDQNSLKLKEQGIRLQFFYNIVKMILLFFFGYILITILNKLKLVEMYYLPQYWNDGSDEDLETETWRKKTEI